MPTIEAGVTTVAGYLGTDVYSYRFITEAVQPDIHASPADIFRVQIDNRENDNEWVYLHIFDAASATIGTDKENFLFPAPPGKVQNYYNQKGWAIATGITVAVTKSGAETTPTGPTGNVHVKLEVT